MTNEVTLEQAIAEEKQAREIQRGRLPNALVYLVRFALPGTTRELADLIGTTTGKVIYIKKNQGFKTIKEDWLPTQSDVDKSHAWLQNHPYADEMQEALVPVFEALDQLDIREEAVEEAVEEYEE